MRKIGIKEIEDIALGAALLGAGGGGDPYIGKLMAIGAIRECGEVELISPEQGKAAMRSSTHSASVLPESLKSWATSSHEIMPESQ